MGSDSWGMSMFLILCLGRSSQPLFSEVLSLPLSFLATFEVGIGEHVLLILSAAFSTPFLLQNIGSPSADLGL